MPYDDMLTETEKAAGVGFIIWGDDPEAVSERNREYKRKKEEVRNAELQCRRIHATRAIASETSISVMRRKIRHLIYKDCVDYAIWRYSNHEKMPKEYRSVVKLNNCISVLLKGYFTKILALDVDKNLLSKIEGISKETTVNFDLEIPYLRVSKIQSFIHANVQKQSGPGSHLELPTEPTRILLSAARLHCEYMDITTRDYKYLEDILTKGVHAVRGATESLSESGCVAAEPYWANTGLSKTYYPKWRVRHLRSLEHYFPENVRPVIDSLNKETFRDIGQARAYLVEAYAQGSYKKMP